MNKKNKFKMIVSLIISLCILAYSVKILIAGNGYGYFGICLGIAIFFGLIALGFKIDIYIKTPNGLKRLVIGIVGLGLLSFVVLEGMIFSQFNRTADENLDYIIVLGARYRDDGPSSILRARLNSAIKYLENNPNTKCILTGGKGYNEPCTEADGMAKYMIEKGIPKERLILEDKASNTIENIQFSKKLYDFDKCSIGIITSNFHLYRAMGIAKKQGLNNVQGISATVVPSYLPEYLFREYFGIVKDILKGNMSLTN